MLALLHDVKASPLRFAKWRGSIVVVGDILVILDHDVAEIDECGVVPSHCEHITSSYKFRATTRNGTALSGIYMK